jgi:glutamate synthase (NADPH/NADH) small chain
MSDVFQFLNIARRDGAKTPAQVRKVEFKEIYAQMDGDQVKEQAGRCLACGNPYCEWK